MLFTNLLQRAIGQPGRVAVQLLGSSLGGLDLRQGDSVPTKYLKVKFIF